MNKYDIPRAVGYMVYLFESTNEYVSDEITKHPKYPDKPASPRTMQLLYNTRLNEMHKLCMEHDTNLTILSTEFSNAETELRKEITNIHAKYDALSDKYDALSDELKDLRDIVTGKK